MRSLDLNMIEEHLALEMSLLHTGRLMDGNERDTCFRLFAARAVGQHAIGQGTAVVQG